MLFYVALLALLLLIITETLLILVHSYAVLRSAQRIEADAGIALERLLREVRDAESITDAGSSFGVNPGKLLLSTSDVSGNPRTVEFYLTNGHLFLKENGVESGMLTGAKTTVSNLVFRKIITTRSTGVKFEMALESGTGTDKKSISFYGTAVLRNSY
jgi:hypothetical protein